MLQIMVHAIDRCDFDSVMANEGEVNQVVGIETLLRLLVISEGRDALNLFCARSRTQFLHWNISGLVSKSGSHRKKIAHWSIKALTVVLLSSVPSNLVRNATRTFG